MIIQMTFPSFQLNPQFNAKEKNEFAFFNIISDSYHRLLLLPAQSRQVCKQVPHLQLL